LDWAVIAAIFFSLFGGLLTWVAIINWRHRHEEKVNLLEAAILKTTGAEPLPLTRFDRALQWFHIIMASIFGPIMLTLGIAMFVDEIGSLI
jgi:hypothetical protein